MPGGATGSREEEGTPPGWARWVTRVSFVCALGALGATLCAVGPHAIASRLAAIGPWFLAIVSVEGVITVLDARAIYATSCGRGEPFGPVVFAQVAGRAVNAVTPTGSLGEATKMSVLTRSMPTSRAIASVLFYDVTSAVVQLVVIAIGAPLTAWFVPLPTPVPLLLFVTAALAAALALVLVLLVQRGMLASLVGVAARLRLVSAKRRAAWQERIEKVDVTLRGTRGNGRRRAIGYVVVAQVIGWGSIWMILAASGFRASAGELAALVSAGVVLGWIASIVPLGLGVAESGNFALFAALGAPPSYGVTLALARRINQIVFAGIGFALLGVWRASRAFSRRRSLT
jgi:hypothetical protein